MDWFRFYHGTPTDPKLTMIAKKLNIRRCEMTAFWECLLDHASQHAPRGFVGNIDLELISFTQDIPVETLLTLQNALTEKGVIVDGCLASWEKRQPKREDNSGERVKAHRLKNKDSDDDVTQCNAVKRSVTQRNARERERKREEKERKKEPQAALVNMPHTDFILPSWVPEISWKDFQEMRVKIKKPMTDRAKNDAIAALEKLMTDGYQVEAVLKQSIYNCWAGLFPVKNQDQSKDDRSFLW